MNCYILPDKFIEFGNTIRGQGCGSALNGTVSGLEKVKRFNGIHD